MVLAVAAVLAFSARSLSRERTRLLQGFAESQLAIVHDLSKSLDDVLLDTEEDSRVISTLVQATRRASPLASDQAAKNMIASFNAMAVVVRHYRSVALFDPQGAIKVSAVDPAESRTMGEALLQASGARAGDAAGSARLTGPIQVAPGRFVYLCSFAAGPDVVVITIDAPRLLQAALRPFPGAKVLVVDPGATTWSGCTPNGPCAPRPASPGDAPAASEEAEGTRWLDPAAARGAGLPETSAVAAWTTVTTPGMGRWRLLLTASASELHEREMTLLRNFILTALGLVAAFGVVGALIVRQQRYAAALGERLRNAETLRSLEGQLVRAEKLATTGVLAAGLAHEIGTPLGIIRARAELLLDGLASGHDRNAVGAIVRQIDHISSTIRQVLDFSRSQAVQVQPIQPAAALRAVTELLDHRFQQQALQVTTAVDPDVPAMAADPNQLQQVLVNLLLNACDACGSGGIISVAVAPAEDPAFVEWSIRDDGAGIAQEHLLAVFDPFFTTKKRGEGTGLGLSVAAGIVRNHGGEITLASTVGAGTTVTMRWPAYEGGERGTHAEG
jgi:signal transduction histidine kinase